MSMEEDIRLPYKYGRLLDRGMSLKEIREHNMYEIQVMHKAIERYEIIRDGQGLSEEMRKTPAGMQLYARYVEETEKYREQMSKNVISNNTETV